LWKSGALPKTLRILCVH